MKKQQGFSLIGMLLAMTVFAISIAVYIPYKQKQKEQDDAIVFMQQTKHLIEQIQLFNYRKSTTEDNFNRDDWPSSLNALMTDYPGTFWPVCSESAAQQGQCRRPESTPWNKPITYTVEHVGLSIYNAFLTIPISQTGDKKAVWARPFYDLSGVTKQPNGDLKIEIKPLLNSIAYDAFLKKDGSTPLTDDWDVGGKSILNAKRVTLAAGNKQQELGTGTQREFLAKHFDRIEKNSYQCAEGLIKTIHTSINAAFAENEEYISIGSFKPYTQDNGDWWRVGMDYNAKIKSLRYPNGKWYIRHSGYINVRLNCSQP